MSGVASAIAKAWAATLDFIVVIGPSLKAGVMVVAGRVWQSLVDNLNDSQAMVKRLKEIIDAEKENSSRPVNGAADRLQQGSFTRKRVDRRQ